MNDREFSEGLARHGYSVICPDLYCRLSHGAPDDIAAAVARSRGGVRDDSVVADCGAALRSLRALPLSNGKVGIIGTCSGGRHALLAASRVTGFDAVADLWGAGVVMAKEELSEARRVAPIYYTADLFAPLLGAHMDSTVWRWKECHTGAAGHRRRPASPAWQRPARQHRRAAGSLGQSARWLAR